MVPRELRDWKPKHPSQLPAPSEFFQQLSAAAEFGYTPAQWAVEHPTFKAQAIAWWIESNLREGYATEKAMEDKPKRGSSGYNPYEAMKRRWMMGGKE